jgi:hypothetical protein
MYINMHENDLRQWFGNRGVQLEENKLTFKVVKKQGNRWVFILDDCFDYDGSQEIELYNLDTMYCECYDAWKAKAFNWDLANLMAKIENDPDYDPEGEAMLLAVQEEIKAKQESM